MARATTFSLGLGQRLEMPAYSVALVGRDPDARRIAATAFDAAPSSWDVSLHPSPPEDADVVVLLPDAPDGDGVRFDTTCPERALDEVRARLESGRGRIGIWAACPGAGATTVSVHLAAAIAETEECCLVDLDPLRGAARRLACPPVDPDFRDERLTSRPVAGGFRLVEGALPRGNDAGTARIIVDGPGRIVQAAGCGRHLIVVPSGRAGVERAGEVLSGFDGPISALIVNRTGWGGELTVRSIQRLLGRRVALELPFSPGLRDAEDRAELLTSPLSPWLNRIHRLARAL